VKGQIVFPAGAAVPERKALDVTQDKAHCLSKGPLLDETLVVNPKNKGIKNVVVWLRPDDKDPKSKLPPNQIHPDDAKRKATDVVIDQPCCMFTPRITTARVGDTIVVKNTAPVAHNFFWSSGFNGNLNPNIPPGGDAKVGPLVAETTPIPYKCSIHPWMAGTVRVFDHPYYAVTDEDGKFTMPNAPAGKYRLVVWHEKTGYLGGAPGRFGTPIEITGPATELKALEFPELAKKD
jgi:plastocyanin